MNFGKGFKPEERRRIFDRHYRSEVIRHTHGTGTGIGLFLCRQIMIEHGGNIGVSIKHAPQPMFPDMYQVVFTVRFPIVESEELTEFQSPPSPIIVTPVMQAIEPFPQADRYTILYVEDDLAHHPHMIPLLSEYFHVIHAPTGQEALDYLIKDRQTNQFNIRLVLLDVSLDSDDDMNERFSGIRGGVELAKAILREEKFDLPTIAWTALTMPEIREELQEIGVNRVMIRTHKTSTVAKLRQLIIKTIKEKQSNR